MVMSTYIESQTKIKESLKKKKKEVMAIVDWLLEIRHVHIFVFVKVEVKFLEILREVKRRDGQKEPLCLL